jgi:hypothetical protein
VIPRFARTHPPPPLPPPRYTREAWKFATLICPETVATVDKGSFDIIVFVTVSLEAPFIVPHGTGPTDY